MSETVKNALDEKRKKLDELRKKRMEQAGVKKKEDAESPRASTTVPTQFFSPAKRDDDPLRDLDKILGKPSPFTEYGNAAPPAASKPSAPRRKVELGASKIISDEIIPVETATYEITTQFPEQPDDTLKLMDEEEKERMNDEIRERKRQEREQQERDAKLEKERQDAERKRRQISAAQKKQILESDEFQDFFRRTSILVERAINQNDHYDITRNYSASSDGRDDKNRKSILTKSATFFDKARVYNRPVTSIDWNPQYKELLLASYAQKEDVLSLDPDGLVLVWSTQMPQRPEYMFSCQSAVLSALFHPSNPKLIIGGTNSGQVIIWDTREKSTPVNRTSLSQGHTHPLYSISAVPSVNLLHNIISLSTDGRLCVWNDNDLVEPTAQIDLRFDRKEVTTTTFSFPERDTNSVVLGSDEGYLYKARIYDTPGIFEGIEAHSAPITAVRFHPIYKNSPREISDLFLSSSYDWTVKLWSSKMSRPLFTFESATDYVYDVQWSPVHPALFASGDGSGSVDFWDLNKDTEVPIHKVKVLTHDTEETKNDIKDRAISKLKWSDDGKKLAVGSSDGGVTVWDVAPDVIKSSDEDATAFYDKMRKAASESPADAKLKTTISIDDGPDIN